MKEQRRQRRFHPSSVTGTARNPLGKGKLFGVRATTEPPMTRELPSTFRTKSRFTVSPMSGSGTLLYGSIDADLDSIVLMALRKEPQARYPTVDEFSADMRGFLEHRPVKARRGNLNSQANKFIRRNRISHLASRFSLQRCSCSRCWQGSEVSSGRLVSPIKSGAVPKHALPIYAN